MLLLEKKKKSKKRKKINLKRGQIREQMILDNIDIVKYVANRFFIKLPDQVLFGQIISAGYLGLIDAVDKYDSTKKVPLRAYARYRINGSILDELRSLDPCSKALRRKLKHVEKVVVLLENKLGREASPEEVSKELNIELEDYYKIPLGEVNSYPLALDAPLGVIEEENLFFIDTIMKNDDALQSIIEMKAPLSIFHELDKLTKVQREVMIIYYYFEFTLAEIGIKMQVHETRILQIRDEAIESLKEKLGDFKCFL